VYSKDLDEHIDLLQYVLLGYVISAKGIEVDEEKVKAIKEWLTPKSIIEVRGSGLACFYLRFV
jgi:hypothetical protein